MLHSGTQSRSISVCSTAGSFVQALTMDTSRASVSVTRCPPVNGKYSWGTPGDSPASVSCCDDPLWLRSGFAFNARGPSKPGQTGQSGRSDRTRGSVFDHCDVQGARIPGHGRARNSLKFLRNMDSPAAIRRIDAKRVLQKPPENSLSGLISSESPYMACKRSGVQVPYPPLPKARRSQRLTGFFRSGLGLPCFRILTSFGTV
jgi:hypothetical protein